MDILSRAQSLKGTLQKKSTQLFVGWQSRYWCIQGEHLVYFESSAQQQPQREKNREIPLKDILEIQAYNKKEFRFKVDDRTYELKAESTQARDEWVSGLKVLHEAAVQTIDPINYRSSMKILKKGSMIQYKNTEKVIAEQRVSSKSINSLEFWGSIGLKLIERELNQQIPSNTRLSKRILIRQCQEGVFFIVSVRSLYEDFEDGKMLPKQYVEPFGFNVLYKVAEGKVKQICKTSSILSVEVFSESKLRLNCGFILQLSNKSNKPDEFSRCFQLPLLKAISIGKEYYNDEDIIITKNLELPLKMYDEYEGSARREKLRSYFDKEYGRVMGRQTHINSLEQLSVLINSMHQHLVEFTNSCQVKIGRPRYDLAAEFADYIHNMVYGALKDFWNQNYETMDPSILIGLAKATQDYQKLIRRYIKDERLTKGTQILYHVYFRKKSAQLRQKYSQVLATKAVNLISVPNTKLYYTQISLKFMQLVEQAILPPLKSIKIGELPKYTSQFQKFIAQEFKLWTSKLQFYLQTFGDISKLAAFCNDCDYYESSIVKLLNNTGIKTEASQQTIKQMHSGIVKQIFLVLFSTIDRNLMVQPNHMLQLSIESLTLEILNKLQILKDHLKVDSLERVYLQSLQEISSYYLDLMTNFQIPSATASPIYSSFSDAVTSKLSQDYSKLVKIYTTNPVAPLSKDAVINALQKLAYLQQLIKADSVITLRRLLQSTANDSVSTDSPIVTQKLVRVAINLKTSLSRGQRNDLLNMALSILNNSSLNSRDESDEQYFEPVSKQTYLDNWAMSSRRSTLTINLNQIQMVSTTRNQSVARPNRESVLIVPSMQGYIQKKKVQSKKATSVKKLFYEDRFFRIIDGYLFWYMNEESTQLQKKIHIESQVVSVSKHPSRSNTFFLELSDCKYKLIAPDDNLANKWVQVLSKYVKSAANNSPGAASMNRSSFTEGSGILTKTISVANQELLFKDYHVNEPQSAQDAERKQRTESVLSTLSCSPDKFMRKPTLSSGIPKSNDGKSKPSKILGTNLPEVTKSQKSEFKKSKQEGQQMGGCWVFKKCM